MLSALFLRSEIRRYCRLSWRVLLLSIQLTLNLQQKGELLPSIHPYLKPEFFFSILLSSICSFTFLRFIPFFINTRRYQVAVSTINCAVVCIRIVCAVICCSCCCNRRYQAGVNILHCVIVFALFVRLFVVVIAALAEACVVISSPSYENWTRTWGRFTSVS